MTKKDVIVVDSEESFREFSQFMKGEQLYELEVSIMRPDGGEFKLNMVFEPLTAYDIQKIYEDAPERGRMTVEEQFDYLCEALNKSIRNWKFSNVARGKANYEQGEISVRDMTQGTRTLLERAVMPGVGKSVEAIEQELTRSSRKLSRDVRGISKELARPEP